MSATTITIVVPVEGKPYRTKQTQTQTLRSMVGGTVCDMMGRGKIIHPMFWQEHAEWNVVAEIYKKVADKKMKVKCYGNDEGSMTCSQNMAVYTHDQFGTSPTFGNLVLVINKKQADKVKGIASLPYYKDATAMELAYEEE